MLKLTRVPQIPLDCSAVRINELAVAEVTTLLASQTIFKMPSKNETFELGHGSILRDDRMSSK